MPVEQKFCSVCGYRPEPVFRKRLRKVTAANGAHEWACMGACADQYLDGFGSSWGWRS